MRIKFHSTSPLPVISCQQAKLQQPPSLLQELFVYTDVRVMQRSPNGCHGNVTDPNNDCYPRILRTLQKKLYD